MLQPATQELATSHCTLKYTVLELKTCARVCVHACLREGARGHVCARDLACVSDAFSDLEKDTK